MKSVENYFAINFKVSCCFAAVTEGIKTSSVHLHTAYKVQINYAQMLPIAIPCLEDKH